MIFSPTFRTAGAVAAAAVLAAFMSAPAPALAAQLMAQAQAPAAMAPAAPAGEATPPAATEAAPAAPAPAKHMSRVEHHNAPMTVERRISRLHSQLHITAAEASEWNTFAQAMREQAQQTTQAIQEQQSAGSMNAVEHLRSYEKVQEAQYEGVKKLVPAFEGLYDKLSPAQKKSADAIFNHTATRRAPKTSG